MKKRLLSMTLATGFLAMGMSMPSCPGQQAMQQQIDALTQKSGEADKKLQALITNAQNTTKEVNDLKSSLATVTQTVIAQKQQLEAMDVQLKEVAAKAASGGKKRK